MLKNKQLIIFLGLVVMLTSCDGGKTSTQQNGTNVKDSKEKPALKPFVRQQNNSFNIISPSDDAYERQADGKVSLTSNKIALGNNNLVGLRFKGIEIPKDSTISSAYIQFSANKDLSSENQINLKISIENSANSKAFKEQTQNLSSRSTHTKYIEWNANSQWKIVNERSSKQRTPDIGELIQKIINKDGWKTGNSISLFLTGQGLKNINSYEESMKVLQVSDLSATLVINLSSISTFTSNAYNDDAEENIKTGFVKTKNSDLELGWDSDAEVPPQLVGIRFTNINITPKSKIHKAYIQFTQDENKNANPFEVSIYGEKSSNPETFSLKHQNLSKRKLTDNGAGWSGIGNWVKLHEAGKLQRTPDLANIIQELVNMPNWKTGNAMAFLIRGKGTRTAEPFESGPELSPKLVVEYTNASTPFVFDKVRLVWNDDPTSTISIIWNKTVGSNGTVYYDKYTKGKCPVDHKEYTQSKTHDKSNQDFGMNNVTARLTNLEPDTDYRFIIKNERGTSECSWFKTAPNTPKPFSYISGGDTKSSGSALKVGRWSNQMVSKVRPLFVLFTGDYNSGLGLNAASWQQWLSDWSTLTRSKDGRMYPLITVHGNHENGDFEVLYKLFDAGNTNKEEKDHVTYNAFSFGGNLLYLVNLNSELHPSRFNPLNLIWVSGKYAKQNKWLKETLIKGQNHTFKVVGYHKPMRPHTTSKSESPAQSKDWAPLMEQYDVDVAYESDTHNHKFTYPIRVAKSGDSGADEGFVRDDEKGILYVGEGSWGASPRKIDDKKSWTLDSGAFNQIKLNRVYPAIGNQPARLDINVIKIAQRNRKGELVNHVEGVREANDENPMALPLGITLHKTPKFGEKISVPFKAQ